MRLHFLSAGLALCAFGCNDDLVEDVPPEVCVSGQRWVGGRRGSEEMYPGRDCVGCHLENDGPQLILGGTIYAVPDTEHQQANDCFGIEGVEIVITGADSEQFKTLSNRAGNFFFEGRPSQLQKPFQAEFRRYDETGKLVQRTPMRASPRYTGCAYCHDPHLDASVGITDATAPEFRRPTDRMDVGGRLTDYFPAAP